MDTRKAKGKVIDPIDFTPDTIQGILPKEFNLGVGASLQGSHHPTL